MQFRNRASVEAMRFDGTNVDEITQFVSGTAEVGTARSEDEVKEIVIRRPVALVRPGYWVVKDSTGVFPMDPAEFDQMYEQVQ